MPGIYSRIGCGGGVRGDAVWCGAMQRQAVFLDRDGVVIADVHLLSRPNQVALCEGVAAGIRRLHERQFLVIVVSNQPVVARGMCSEAEVNAVHAEIQRRLIAAGGPEAAIDAFYFCPHHPNADLADYRRDCECRKPRPGMLLRAAEDWQIDCARSFLVGDRITDIIAGQAAHCATVWLQTGTHLHAPIQSPDRIEPNTRADFIAHDFTTAVAWIFDHERTGDRAGECSGESSTGSEE